jgi:deoxyuridine 5'-triphosphate nucleotidohydrolase
MFFSIIKIQILFYSSTNMTEQKTEFVVTPEKAYFLGYFTFSKENSELKDSHKLVENLSFCSFNFDYSYSDLFKLEPEMMQLLDKRHELGWHYIRGMFDKCGTINDNSYTAVPICSIISDRNEIIQQFCSEIPKTVNTDLSPVETLHWLNKDNPKVTQVYCTVDKVSFIGYNALDFLGKMYNNMPKSNWDANLCCFINYSKFKKWLNYKSDSLQCDVFKTHPDAIIPSKVRISDVGYDLSVIKEHKKLGNNVVLYDTGLKVKVSHGWYPEIVPRSSLSKTGFILANSTGIIDPTYRGNLYIALAKLNDNVPDLIFPFKCCQLIFRQFNHFSMIESSSDFDETERLAGGFGSTG